MSLTSQAGFGSMGSGRLSGGVAPDVQPVQIQENLSSRAGKVLDTIEQCHAYLDDLLGVHKDQQAVIGPPPRSLDWTIPEALRRAEELSRRLQHITEEIGWLHRDPLLAEETS